MGYAQSVPGLERLRCLPRVTLWGLRALQLFEKGLLPGGAPGGALRFNSDGWPGANLMPHRIQTPAVLRLVKRA